MKLHILKTNITSREMLDPLLPFFENNPVIYDWSVDFYDADKVLRVEAREDLPQELLIHLVKCYGFLCEELED
jgi:hypothetical protein